MAYQAEFSPGQILTVMQQGSQTAIALSSLQFGQQQSQQMNLTTGAWKSPPTLFKTSSLGWILQIEALKERFFVNIQANGIRVLGEVPLLIHAQILRLEEVPDPAIAAQASEGIPPMQPMQPMQMGNMEMQMEPMRMVMGNMQLSMSHSEPAKSRFCPQCGEAVEAQDRFCSHCGNQLKS